MLITFAIASVLFIFAGLTLTLHHRASQGAGGTLALHERVDLAKYHMRALSAEHALRTIARRSDAYCSSLCSHPACEQSHYATVVATAALEKAGQYDG